MWVGWLGWDIHHKVGLGRIGEVLAILGVESL